MNTTSDNDRVKQWHHYFEEFRESLRNNDKKAFTRLIDEALSGNHIIRERGMLIDGNEHGRSFSCMDQSTLGLNLLKAGRKWGVTEWVDDGIAAFKVLLTDYEAGGLRLHDAESDTSWYCGITSRNQEAKGGTLNKHLYSTRTFFEAADVMRDLGKMKIAARYEEAGEEGFLKLVEGSQGPTLEDYFVRKDDGKFHLKAWTYYACGDASKDSPYYLKNTEKNGKYHVYEMNLMYAIGHRLENGADTDGDFDFTPFTKKQVASLSALGAYLQVYDEKLKTGGLDQDTPTSFGQFGPTLNGDGDLLHGKVTEWFGGFLYAPPIRGTNGNDTLGGSDLGETIRGRQGSDTLVGKAGPDTLRGGTGPDSLRGGGGDDILIGGLAKDGLIGQKGDDVFLFAHLKDSRPGKKRDIIVDFEPERDVVDLRQIDAREDILGNQVFRYIGPKEFSEKPGELRFKNEILRSDTDGDGTADFEIEISGIMRMSEFGLLALEQNAT